MPNVGVIDLGNLPKEESLTDNLNTLISQYGERRDKKTLDNILSQYDQNIEQENALEHATLAIQKSDMAPSRRLQALDELGKGQHIVGEKQKALNVKIKAQNDKIEADRTRKALENEGINPDFPTGIQTKQYEDKIADQRAQQILGKGKKGEKVEGEGAQAAEGQGIESYTDAELVALSGVRGFAEPSKQELKRRQEANKEERADIRENRKETLPKRQEIATKAEAARKGIQNKTQLLEVIDRGNLDDPTFASIASSLPLNLGKRLLSEDTVVYKAGLVDEFTDLRNIFQGQTRVKEIDILEDKLADLYLTDDQKKAILKSRINALQSDVVREEAAAEVEEKYPNLGVLQFSKKVDELAKPKLEKLFNHILDEQKSILNQAEKRKQLPLNLKDPEDRKIMNEILIEAGGNPDRALKLAKEKGYKFK
jgi:hypothetical protein